MNSQNIPKAIHFIHISRILPDRYSPYVEKAMTLHPEWEINIWDDASALTVVSEHFPGFMEMYNSFEHPVQKADTFRLMMLYLKGGFYSDLDMLYFKSLDELCRNRLVLGVEKELSGEECRLLGHQHAVRIANYMMGSIPRHPFWLEVLTAIGHVSGKEIRSDSDILETTGPGMLTNVFHEVKDRYPDIIVLPNNDRPCLRSCGQASCHFGEFAAHLHFGNWRQDRHEPPVMKALGS